MRRNPSRRGRVRTTMIALTMAATAVPAAAASASAPQQAAAPEDCPKPVPVSEVKEGMTGWGLSVSKGTTPEKFNVKVTGVLKDGIAPGIDMIVADAESPAIDKAGGIWAGMSGSPIYAPDGRIIGALGYGFSSTSKVAGITPAEEMIKVLNRTDTNASKAPKTRVKLPARLQKKAVASGVPAKAAAAGMSALPLGNAISGFSQQRVGKFNKELSKSGLRLYPASGSTGAPAPAGSITAGGNFAATQSYGDVTRGGVGTTTMVCDGKAVAFGHPMALAGKTTFGAHAADAIDIIQDPAFFGPYKLANFGGLAGTVDQDRNAAIRATLGANPPGTKVTSTIKSGGNSRTGTSVANMQRDVPGLSGAHLLSTIDRVHESWSAGSAVIGWTVTGTANGKPFTLKRTNRYADKADISWISPAELTQQLGAVEDNKFAPVKFTGVKLNADVNSSYGHYSLSGVQRYTKGKWTTLKSGSSLKAKAGRTLTLRAQLSAHQGAARTVKFKVTVPKKQKGRTGKLVFAGGYERSDMSIECLFGIADCGGQVAAKSFDGLIKALGSAQRNDEVRVALTFGKPKVKTVTKKALVDHIVEGSRSFRVKVR